MKKPFLGPGEEFTLHPNADLQNKADKPHTGSLHL